VRSVVFVPLVLALALPALAGEEPQPQPPPPTTAEKPTPWEQWITTHAYDPIRRRWVPIPDGVEPGPKTGYIWNLGRWELVKIVHRPHYGWGYFDHRGRWHGQDERRAIYRTILWKRRHYLDTIPKKTFEQPHRATALKLDRPEARRLEDLLQRNLIQELLIDDTGEQQAVVSYRRRTHTVSLSGSAELVAKLATLITDESTYKAYTTAQSHGNIVEIVTIVDLGWLERHPEPALNIADLNFDGLIRLVGAHKADHRRLRKALWLNDLFGTVTIVDQPDTIRKVRDYLAIMPYAPKPDRMTISDR